MSLIRYPVYDIQYDGDWGIPGVTAYVETTTGEVYNHQLMGDSENGFYYRDIPTGKFTEYVNKQDSHGFLIYGSAGYQYGRYYDGGTGGEIIGKGITPANAWQIGAWVDDPRAVSFFRSINISPVYDPVYGWILPASVNPGEVMTKFRNAIYTGGGDFITKALDAGAGVYALMAAVGYLAISGAGIGVANEVTQAVQTSETLATVGEQAAQTIATESSMTAAQIQAELNSLTMTTALDANAINAAAQAGIINAAEQAALLETVAKGALDLTSTVGRNLAQKALEEAAKSTPTTTAEKTAQLLKDQATKLATTAATTAIKTLTGGNSNAVAPRGYIRNPVTGELTPAPQSDSVLPIALIAALLMFS